VEDVASDPIDKLSRLARVSIAVGELIRSEITGEYDDEAQKTILTALNGAELRVVGERYLIVRLADHSLFRLEVKPLEAGDASWIEIMGGWKNTPPVQVVKPCDVSIQSVEGDFEFLVEQNASTFDTDEVGDGYPQTFFQDTRVFSSGKPKVHDVHTNLVGNGKYVPRGQTLVIRKIGVTFLDDGIDAESEKVFLEKAQVTFWDDYEPFQKIGFVEHELGLSSLGEEIIVTLPEARRISETQAFGVVLRSPALKKSYPVRVTLHGERGRLTFKGRPRKMIYKPDVRFGEFGAYDGRVAIDEQAVM
jgi:hypothetical protein